MFAAKLPRSSHQRPRSLWSSSLSATSRARLTPWSDLRCGIGSKPAHVTICDNKCSGSRPARAPPNHFRVPGLSCNERTSPERLELPNRSPATIRLRRCFSLPLICRVEQSKPWRAHPWSLVVGNEVPPCARPVATSLQLSFVSSIFLPAALIGALWYGYTYPDLGVLANSYDGAKARWAQTGGGAPISCSLRFVAPSPVSNCKAGRLVLIRFQHQFFGGCAVGDGGHLLPVGAVAPDTGDRAGSPLLPGGPGAPAHRIPYTSQHPRVLGSLHPFFTRFKRSPPH